MIKGNIDGIRKSILEILESIYDMNIMKETVVTTELVDIISQVTKRINREISVVINRKGNVTDVIVGDSSTVEIPLLDIKQKKLSGSRIIHTHPNGNSNLSYLDKSALLKLKLDCIAAIGVSENLPLDITLGFCTIYDDKLTCEIEGPFPITQIEEYPFLKKINYLETILEDNYIEIEDIEKAILVGIDSEESLDELEELSKACNVLVLNKIYQNKSKIDSTFFIGKGKVEELSLIIQGLGANIVIFDDELSGSQVRNLEQILGIKVIDRTTLILEIFAKRARTKEAKIQVELAQLKYRLSRLIGLGTVLSRTGGGIGTRGPGEKKLETDRRHIKERIYDLIKELDKIKNIRMTQREKRTKGNISKVSLVGYTNAGKSTLRNSLCEIAAPKEFQQKGKVFEADMLFATLDTTTRAITLPDGRLITLTDTVGFVRKLPHDLVEAFKSTLEEVIYSDLLLHIVDSSSETVFDQIEAVNQVLKELGVKDKSIILVLNKIDKADVKSIEKIKDKYLNNLIIEISAKEGINLVQLLKIVSSNLPHKLEIIKCVIPYSEQGLVSLIHNKAKVISEEYKEDGTFITFYGNEELKNKCIEYIV